MGIIRVIMKSSISPEDSDFSTMNTHVNNMRDANDILISIFFLIYGALFLIYGTKLNCRIYKTVKTSKSGTSFEGAWLTELFSVLLFACFCVRCVMFSMRILFDQCIEGDCFFVFTYLVPELVPAILILLSVNSRMFRDNEADDMQKQYETAFIDPLLQEEKDSELFLAGGISDPQNAAVVPH